MFCITWTFSHNCDWQIHPTPGINQVFIFSFVTSVTINHTSVWSAMLILHGAYSWQLIGFSMLFLCLTFSHLHSAVWNGLKKQTNWDCCPNALQHIWWNHNVCMSFNNISIFFDLHWPDPAGSSLSRGAQISLFTTSSSSSSEVILRHFQVSQKL